VHDYGKEPGASLVSLAAMFRAPHCFFRRIGPQAWKTGVQARGTSGWRSRLSIPPLGSTSNQDQTSSSSFLFQTERLPIGKSSGRMEACASDAEEIIHLILWPPAPPCQNTSLSPDVYPHNSSRNPSTSNCRRASRNNPPIPQNLSKKHTKLDT
jgi:hypothetical protein